MLGLPPPTPPSSPTPQQRARPVRRAWRLRAIALLCIATATAGAQESPPPASFGASVDVSLVQLDVFVDDARGAPVGGLTQADFSLEVDGEVRRIEGFYEARADRVVEAPAAARSAEAPAPTVSPAPRPLSLAVVFDDAHLQPAGRKRNLERLAKLLSDRLRAGDRVLLATLDPGLRVRRTFDATGPLDADLEAIGRSTADGTRAEIARRTALAQIRDIRQARGCEGRAEMMATADAWAAEVENEGRTSLAALRSVLYGLGGLRGRKALVYVSEGMALSPGREAQSLVERLCPSDDPPPPRRSLLAEVQRTSHLANTSQVALYTLDAGGQRTLGSAEDEAPAQDLESQSLVRADGEDPAFALAADTGGRALLESNRPEALLVGLAQDLERYYSIAFSPRAGEAGRAHRIHVSVARPHVRVRAPAFWVPTGALERLEARLVSVLQYGDTGDNPLRIRLTADEARRQPDGEFTAALHLAAPASTVTLLPAGERRQGRLRLLLALRDGDGRTTPVRSLALPVDLPARTSAEGAEDGDAARLDISIRLRPGRNTLAVAVLDETGQVTSVVRCEVPAGTAR